MKRPFAGANGLSFRQASVNRPGAVLLAGLLFATIQASCIPPRPGGPAGVIEGKVLLRKERVTGAVVSAVSDLGVTGREKGFSAVTIGDGSFRIVLPPGNYYLSARKDPDFAGFFGGNPVTVRADMVSRVAFRGVNWSGKTIFRDAEDTGLEGLALQDGRPVPGAVVQVFLDAAGHFRGPGYATAPVGADGRFHLPLPPGRYYVLARVRRGEGKTGPLRIGDRYAWYPGNPLYLPEGKMAEVELSFLEVEKDPSRVIGEASHAVEVSGSVLDGGGRPVTGAYACLYESPEPLGQPVFVSDPTDATGAFTVRVTRPGDYWLVVRLEIGRPLVTNEYVAFFRGAEGHRLSVREGKNLGGLKILWEGSRVP
jgi:hypothetical protein